MITMRLDRRCLGVLARAARAAGFAQGYPNKPVRADRALRAGRHHRHRGPRRSPSRWAPRWASSVIVDNKAGGGGVDRRQRNRAGRARRLHAGHGHRVDHGGQPGHQPEDRLQPDHRLHADHQHRGHAQRDRGASVASRPRTTRAFLAELKKNPGKYSYASSGTGGIGHLQMELFKNLSGTFVTHIPYRGAGPALQRHGGRPGADDLRQPALGAALHQGRPPDRRSWSRRRSAWRRCPTCPTFKEVGLEPVNRMAYYGIYGPKGMPKDVVDKIARRASRRRWKTRRCASASRTPARSSSATRPEQFAAQIEAEFEVYKKVVDKQKLTLD